MSEPVRITPPLDEETLGRLAAGTRVLISGEMIGARDQAHLRMNEALARGQELPFDPRGAIIYYVGPTPGTGGRAVGAAGPTTSARMDSICEPLFRSGVRATVGKGPRTAPAKEAMRRHGAVYLAATGGAGALLGARIEKAEVLAYDDLGCEALRRLTVRDFPAVVAIDLAGRDLFEEGPAAGRVRE
ncbi:MAG: FumA C-terminus/TtdB family hydratase beta subunit [Planctomycetota bacterium]|jgi:fumarate hydratase subunit beta